MKDRIHDIVHNVWTIRACMLAAVLFNALCYYMLLKD